MRKKQNIVNYNKQEYNKRKKEEATKNTNYMHQQRPPRSHTARKYNGHRSDFIFICAQPVAFILLLLLFRARVSLFPRFTFRSHTRII